MSSTAVEALGLVKRYAADRPPAVDDLVLEVGHGEVYGLLGRNGSGKSTTVGMLATLLAPSAGRARVAGHDVVAEAAAVRRRIGVTLQETGVDPRATGRELLVLHGGLLGLDGRAARRRADELLDAFDLAGAAGRATRTYSGGMRRRLDLALALVGEPSVVFLDEPTTGLDPLSRQGLWEEVRRLRDAGTAILLTTQYLEEADRLADRVGILADGRLRVEGPPEDLKRRVGGDVLTIELEPADAEAAARLLGGAAERDGRVRLEVEDGSAAVPRALAALARRGLVARGVALARPTLDDVFLQVAGARLADDAADPHEAPQEAAA
jgi:ABC-2 type transport system ATP-binding protein